MYTSMNGGPNSAEGDVGSDSTTSWQEGSAQEQRTSKDVPSLDHPSTAILIDCKRCCCTDDLHLLSSIDIGIILFCSRLADRADEISFFVFPFSAPFPV